VLSTSHFGNSSPHTLPGRGIAVYTQAVVDVDGDGS
jgi:hypothetical protein